MKLNPNTGTLPMFRTRTDADITLGIYRRHPILNRDDDPNSNEWELTFARLFDLTNNSGLFRPPEEFSEDEFNGWSYQHNGKEYLPLYEAKMLGHFDHRFSTYRGATQAHVNVGALPRPTDEQHDDPNLEPLARQWVDRNEVAAKLADKWDREWLLGWRDITKAEQMRTLIPSVLPATAVGNSFLLAFPGKPADGPLLQAVWSSTIFDYVARQKLSGTHMNYFTAKQLACPQPSSFEQPIPWQPDQSLADWVRPYVLELSYTSWRLKP